MAKNYFFVKWIHFKAMRKSVAKWMLLTIINTNETYENAFKYSLHLRDVAKQTRADLRPLQTE